MEDSEAAIAEEDALAIERKRCEITAGEIELRRIAPRRRTVRGVRGCGDGEVSAIASWRRRGQSIRRSPRTSQNTVASRRTR